MAFGTPSSLPLNQYASHLEPPITSFGDDLRMKNPFTRKTLILTLLVSTFAITVGTIASINADARGSQCPVKFSIALVGDEPYVTKELTQTPTVIEATNASMAAFGRLGGHTMSGEGDEYDDAT
jgi:hypothetical protein